MVVGQTGEFADVVVIGGGPAGYAAAIRAAQLGRSVILVERGSVGGVCLNEGCIPSKALLSASRLFQRVRDASAMGINAHPELDFGRLMAWKDGVVARLSGGVLQLLKRYGVMVKTGTAYFASEHRVAVEREQEFEFVDFGGAIVATGSRPLPLADIPFASERVISPEQSLALTALPERLAVVGGGGIGLEIATAYARLGTAVTVIEPKGQLLSDIDPALAQVVGRGARTLAIDVRLNTLPRVLRDGRLETELQNGERAELPVEIIVAAIARIPNTDGLGLERAGVQADSDGYIPVDAAGRTTARGIYAAGDVVRGPLVAHRAIAQGRVAAEALCGMPAAYDPLVLPLAYFTEPEVMSAGLTEDAAHELGVAVASARFPLGASGRAATLEEQLGFVQVIFEKATGRVMGMHAAGPLATELAGEAALAIELGATLEDLSLTIHPHPTLSEAFPEAAWLALEAPLHVFRAR